MGMESIKTYWLTWLQDVPLQTSVFALINVFMFTSNSFVQYEVAQILILAQTTYEVSPATNLGNYARMLNAKLTSLIFVITIYT